MIEKIVLVIVLVISAVILTWFWHQWRLLKRHPWILHHIFANMGLVMPATKKELREELKRNLEAIDKMPVKKRE